MIGSFATLKAILHHWFITNDIAKFDLLNSQKLFVEPITYQQKSDTTSWDNQIEFTPTLLINGYKLPSQYSITDVIQMMVPLLNDVNVLEKLTNN